MASLGARSGSSGCMNGCGGGGRRAQGARPVQGLGAKGDGVAGRRAEPRTLTAKRAGCGRVSDRMGA